MSKKPKSRYALNEAWRLKNCGGAPLPLYPDVMALPSHMKPWKGAN